MAIAYDFDRFLRYDELSEWLHQLGAAHPDLVTVETYGRSHEGRDLLLVTVTDTAHGPHDSKPAHWIDASIHAEELTATVAACHVLQHLIDGYVAGDEQITRALRSRTFYVVPRVNPDGAEWVLSDVPRLRRSSVRPWPYRDGRRWPGLSLEDVDGDGRILQMRVADPDGAWMPHPDEPRLLVAVPPDGSIPPGTVRYRVHSEGRIEHYDGFTVPTPPPPEGLDLNRNFPAGWGTNVRGSGDHPLSEPEIDALVRAIVARPNICGYNAFHTSGGVLLRPSSIAADSTLPPMDVWAYRQLAERGTALTGYTSHSVYEDFTWDPTETMSGAADDWAYEHLGVYSWTTEFWDIVHAATGTKQSTHFWYTGPTTDEALAVLRWLDGQPSDDHTVGHVDWYPFDHPQLGPVELGGWNDLYSWTNPAPHLLRAEVGTARRVRGVPGARVTVPRDQGHHGRGARRGHVPDQRAHRQHRLVADPGDRQGAEERPGPSDRRRTRRRRGSGRTRPVRRSAPRQEAGQLDGGSAARFNHGSDGTPDRTVVSWVVRCPGRHRVDRHGPT